MIEAGDDSVLLFLVIRLRLDANDENISVFKSKESIYKAVLICLSKYVSVTM